MKQPIDLKKLNIDIENLADMVEDFDHVQEEICRQGTNNNSTINFFAMIGLISFFVAFMLSEEALKVIFGILTIYPAVISIAVMVDNNEMKNNPRRYALDYLKGKIE